MTWLSLNTTKINIGFRCGVSTLQQTDGYNLASLLTLNQGYKLDADIFYELLGFCTKPGFVLHRLVISYLWGGRMKSEKRKPPKLKAFFSHEKVQEVQTNKDTITEVVILEKFIKLALAKV